MYVYFKVVSTDQLFEKIGTQLLKMCCCFLSKGKGGEGSPETAAVTKKLKQTMSCFVVWKQIMVSTLLKFYSSLLAKKIVGLISISYFLHSALVYKHFLRFPNF